MESTQTTFQKTLLIVVGLICLLPITLNLIGIEFGSGHTTLDASAVAQGSVKTDALFHTLSGAFHHALLEWSAVSIAILAMLTSFIHYSVRRDVTIPIIGIALFCAGLVDAFHTLAATRIIEANTPNTDFIPFTWALSRTFNAGIMICGVLIALWITNREKTHPVKGTRKGILTISLISTLFVAIAYLIVHKAATSDALPQTMYPNALITRPYDVLPLALFLTGSILFWVWYKKRPSPATFALLICTLPEIATQLHMAFGSTALFDNHFNIAHFLKIIAYTTAFIGILQDIITNHTLQAVTQNIATTSAPLHTQTIPDLKIRKAQYALSIRIPLAVFIVTLITASFITFTNQAEMEKIITQREITDLKHETEAIRPILSNQLIGLHNDVVFLNQTPPIQGIAAAVTNNRLKDKKIWAKRLSIIFRATLDANPNFAQIRYIGLADKGRELVRVERKRSGIVTTPPQLLQQKAQSSYFNEVNQLGKGDVYFSKIELNREHGKVTQPHTPVIRVAMPVFNEATGKRFGFIIINADFNKIAQKVHSSVYEETRFYLANSLGDYLIHPDKQQTFGFDLNKRHQLQNEFPTLANSMANNINKRGTEFEDLTDNNGSKHIAYYSSLRFDELGITTPYHLLFIYDNKIHDQQVAGLKNRGLILSLSISILVLGLAVIAARRLTNPLTQLTNGIEHYEQTGELIALPTKSNDEVGVLARAFHNVTIAIEQRTQELNDARKYVDGITEEVPLLLSYVDNTETYRFVNKNYERWFGVSKSAFIGKKVADGLGEEAYAELSPYIQSALAGTPISFDMQVPYKDGGTRHIHASYLPDINETGNVDGFLFR